MIDTNELRQNIAMYGLEATCADDLIGLLNRLEAAEKDLIVKEEVIDSLAAVVKRLDAQCDAAEVEAIEQARLNGMGSKREAALMSKLEAAEKARDFAKEEVERLLALAHDQNNELIRLREEWRTLRAKLTKMERQEPVAWARKLGLDVPSFGCVTDLKYRPSDIPESSYIPLYLAPGAKGE